MRNFLSENGVKCSGKLAEKEIGVKICTNSSFTRGEHDGVI